MLSRDPAAAVQRAIFYEYLSGGRLVLRLGFFLVSLVFWPFKSLVLAFRLSKAASLQVVAARPISIQFFHQLYLAWFHGVNPLMYYQLGIVAAESPVRPMKWLQHGHAGLLLRALRNESTTTEIKDKQLFSTVMEKLALPVPPTIAIFEDGCGITANSAPAFEINIRAFDSLFVKPVRSSCGMDSARWERKPSGLWSCQVSPRSRQGERQRFSVRDQDEFSVAEMHELLCFASGLGALMVQPCLQNHPDLGFFGCTGLITLRVLGGLGNEGMIPLRAVLYLPYEGSIISQQGLKVSVDVAAGQLGKVFHSNVDQRFFSMLPRTAVQVEGADLPFWNESLNVLKKAHAALPDYPFLGWDIAICPEGPVILEANGNFATDSLQKPGSKPLIDDKFLAVFNHWAQKRNHCSA